MRKFQLFKSDSDRYSFRLTGENNETLLYGKGHFSKDKCLNSIEILKTSIQHDDRIVRSDNAWFSFEILDENKNRLAKSQSFNTIDKREDGIRWLRDNGNSLPVEEV